MGKCTLFAYVLLKSRFLVFNLMNVNINRSTEFMATGHWKMITSILKKTKRSTSNQRFICVGRIFVGKYCSISDGF